MFSTAQVIFATFFCIVFTMLIIFSYKKDKKRYQQNYKGVIRVLIAFAAFVFFLFMIKFFLKT